MDTGRASEPGGTENGDGRAGTTSAPPRTILVIEDNDDAREMLIAVLSLAGHEVRGAASGSEGLALAVAEPPEVALVDVGLPDVDGFEVAQQLRTALGERVRLVALTGYGQPEDRQRSRQAGFDEHLVKPVAPDAIMAAVARR